MNQLKAYKANFNQSLIKELREGKIYINLTEKDTQNMKDFVAQLLEQAFPFHEGNIEKAWGYYLTRKESFGYTHNWVVTNTPEWSTSFKHKREVKFLEILQPYKDSEFITSFVKDKTVCFILKLKKNLLEETAAFLFSKFNTYDVFHIQCENEIRILKRKRDTEEDILEILNNLIDGEKGSTKGK